MPQLFILYHSDDLTMYLQNGSSIYFSTTEDPPDTITGNFTLAF